MVSKSFQDKDMVYLYVSDSFKFFLASSWVWSNYNVHFSIQYVKKKDSTFFQGEDIVCLFSHNTFNCFWHAFGIWNNHNVYMGIRYDFWILNNRVANANVYCPKLKAYLFLLISGWRYCLYALILFKLNHMKF